MNTKDINKVRAGRLGGETTYLRHGPEHMSAIGRRGAHALHDKYHLAPVGLSRFALVDRETGIIVAFLDGGD